MTSEPDAARLLGHAESISEIVSKYTRYTERQAMECVMRVVGHLCATGGEGDA